jgi:hypothetical protein
VGSLLKPLLKKVTPLVGSRMLWEKNNYMKFHGSVEDQRNYLDMKSLQI